MPPLIAAVLIGAGAYAGFRAARHLWEQLGSSRPEPVEGVTVPSEAEAAIAEKNLGTLEYDPASGVYRPSRGH